MMQRLQELLRLPQIGKPKTAKGCRLTRKLTGRNGDRTTKTRDNR